MFNGVGVRFADFIWILKNGEQGGGFKQTP